MNKELSKWQMLRSQADALLKQNLNDEKQQQNKSKIAKALVIYAQSDLTVKCLQMRQKPHSKSEN